MHARMIVVAAHPDDETIGAASLLVRVRRAAVVHLTDGVPRDPPRRPGGARDRAAHARRRRQEALAALAEVHLGPAEVITLGAAEGEAVDAIAPLARDLAGLFRALRPVFVVTHALEGGHPDHDAAAVAVRAAAALVQRREGSAPRLLEMASYHLQGLLVVRGEFLPGGPPVRERLLTAGEREAKRRMLARYATRRAALAHYPVDVERFRSAPAIQLLSPPHPPPLLYEMMGWSTFELFRERARAALGALGLAAGWDGTALGAGFA